MKFNRNLYPDGGYFFTMPDGTRIRADGWRSLENRIRGYRAVNKMDPGNPWEEIQAQYCSRQPSLCGPERTHVPEKGHNSLTFNQRVQQWFVEVVNRKRVNKLPRVSDKLAAARAAICARCPAQKSLNEACKACLTSINTSRKGLLDGSKSKFLNLQPCGVLGEDCSTSVYLDQEPKTAAGQPGDCWRHRK